MRFFIADFETYWSTDHSLTKMNPIAYVLHPETEIQSLAIKELGSSETYVYFGETKIQTMCDKTDWSDVMLIGHNMSGFDAMIFAWRFGVKPKMWGCTLGMARPFFGLTAGGSLKKVAAALNIGEKLSLEATNTKGKKLKDFTVAELAAMKEYNIQDVLLCEGIFKNLVKRTPKKELLHIDAITRMLTEPVFAVDVPLLTAALETERARKHTALLELANLLGVHDELDDDQTAAEVAKTLGSAPKFVQLLETLGVDAPTKLSPTTGKTAPALAKTDEGFIALQTHDNPLVAAAAQTRLGVKSSILETRIATFLDVANYTDGMMPVPQQYYAAHTGRNGGGGASLNLCNLPRVSGDKPSNVLRNSLIAPRDHKVVVADLSGIELRVNMFLWKVPYAMALFTADPEHADAYKALAADVFNVPVDQVQKHQRQAAKAMALGCGYGLGNWGKFQTAAKSLAGLDVEEADAVRYIAEYRAKHPEVVAGWNISQNALTAIARGTDLTIDPWGFMHTDSEGIVLPSGRKIRYPGLHQERNEKGRNDWVFGEGRNRKFIHGAKSVENQVQALSRDIFKDNLLEIKKLTGWFPAHEVYDELVYVVPESEAEDMLSAVLSIMRTPPKWWPELAVWAEGDIADSYGAAK
jgi:DNA polymerase I-like protein with 3'-5' exonuclease and polymerase domains